MKEGNGSKSETRPIFKRNACISWKWRHERIKLPERITRRVLYVFRFEDIAYSKCVFASSNFSQSFSLRSYNCR